MLNPQKLSFIIFIIGNFTLRLLKSHKKMVLGKMEHITGVYLTLVYQYTNVGSSVCVLLLIVLICLW